MQEDNVSFPRRSAHQKSLIIASMLLLDKARSKRTDALLLKQRWERLAWSTGEPIVFYCALFTHGFVSNFPIWLSTLLEGLRHKRPAVASCRDLRGASQWGTRRNSLHLNKMAGDKITTFTTPSRNGSQRQSWRFVQLKNKKMKRGSLCTTYLSSLNFLKPRHRSLWTILIDNLATTISFWLLRWSKARLILLSVWILKRLPHVHRTITLIMKVAGYGGQCDLALFSHMTGLWPEQWTGDIHIYALTGKVDI
jgi:hypothetical protein